MDSNNIDIWKKVFYESNKLIHEIDILRVKPRSSDDDLSRLRELENRLADIKESLRPEERVYNTVMRDYYDRIFAGGIRVKKTSCALDDSISLTPIQRFLKSYFSTHSDASGLLLFHGIGVGKTCTAISIAEEFANRGTRVMVLTKHSLMNQFTNEIYDVKKLAFGEKGELDIEKSSHGQCTGKAYLSDYSLLAGNADKKSIVHRIESKIKSRYTIESFHGILKVVDDIKEDVGRFMKPGSAAYEIGVDERIREAFSDMLLIIDEIHNLRDVNSAKSDKALKAISNAAMHVARCSVNMKLLILTATPMFNETVDAIWILNFLRTNDGLPHIREEDVFENDGRTLSSSGAKKLADALQGFVSYAPVGTETEPELYPVVRYQVRNPAHIKVNKTFQHAARGFQLSEIKRVSISENTTAQNVANVSFPRHNFDDVFETHVETGNRHCFKYRNGVEPFLSPGMIKDYAVKIASIVESAKNAKGIVFVYSQLINTGLVPIAIALEHAGFKRRYGVKPILIAPDENKNPIKPDEKVMRYAILCGRQEITEDAKSTLATMRSYENRHGDDIKVLLGSDVMSEGIDLKNVREVHILEPWWHLNKIKQCVGRAVRRCSHAALPEDQRTVDIFLHSVNGSIDEKKYNVSGSKGDAIASVERILRDNAIDSCLFNEKSSCDRVHKRLDDGSDLNEYVDVIVPVIEDFLSKHFADEKTDVVHLSVISNVLKQRFFPSTKLSNKELQESVHKMLLRNNPKDQYLPEIRSFIPFAAYRYMQLRERRGKTFRPSALRKKLFYDRSTSSMKDRPQEEDEAHHEFSYAFTNYVKLNPSEILESVRLQTVRLKTDVRSTMTQKIGEYVVNRLSNVLIDYAVDRLTPSELLSLISVIMKASIPESNILKEIARSMVDAGYLLMDSSTNEYKFGYDYFNRVYYKMSEDDKRLVKAEPFDISGEVEKILKERKHVAEMNHETREIRVKGGMSFIGPNVPYEFKTSRIAYDGGWTRGMVCSSSVMDKEKLVSIISSIGSSKIKEDEIDKSKASKALLCTMIELFLRLEGRESFHRCS